MTLLSALGIFQKHHRHKSRLIFFFFSLRRSCFRNAVIQGLNRSLCETWTHFPCRSLEHFTLCFHWSSLQRLRWYLKNWRHSRTHNVTERTQLSSLTRLGWREVSRVCKGYWTFTLSYLKSFEVKCQVNVKSSLCHPRKHSWHFSLSL